MLFSLLTAGLGASLAGAAIVVSEAVNTLDTRGFPSHFFVTTDVQWGGLQQNLGTNAGIWSEYFSSLRGSPSYVYANMPK